MMRSRKKARFEQFKFIAGLLVMAAMAYAFTGYLDADIGVVVCAFLILAPLLSLLLAWLSARTVSVQMEAPDYLLKGRHFSVNVKLTTESRLPVPFVRFTLDQDANFTPDDDRAVQSAMTSAEPVKISLGMTAQYAGCGLLSVGELVVSDYLGMFHFPVRQIPAPRKVGVIPAIPSLTGAGIMLHTVSDLVLTQDEEEEETSASFSSQTMPGYIHRDYVPGDNLKRINWKLSAKRNRLMVRMDEAASTVRPTVILDLQPEIEAAELKRREMIMEGALGFLALLVKQGVPCTIRYASDGAWKCLVLENEDAVESAAVELSTADFRNDGNRIDLSAMQEKAGAYLIYTSRPDAGLSAQLTALHKEGYVCCVFPVMPDMPELSGADVLWQLAEDFSMTAIQK